MTTLPVVVMKSLFQDCAVAVDRRRTAAIREESCGEPDVLHVLERRAGNVAAIAFVAIDVRTVVEHGDAVADQLDMAEFLGRDAGDQAVERAQLVFAAKVEALEHVVSERRHLAVFAAEQFLQRCSGIRVGGFGGGSSVCSWSTRMNMIKFPSFVEDQLTSTGRHCSQISGNHETSLPDWNGLLQ